MPGELASSTTVTKSAGTTATHSTKTYQTSTTQDTVVHELTDGGDGTFGPWGSANYLGQSINVRLVELTKRTEGYASDHEDASTFEDLTSVSGPAGGTAPSGGGSTSAKGGSYSDSAVGEQMLAASTVVVRYAVDFNTPQTAVQSFAPPTVSIDLCPLTTDYILPGSVQFTWMGHIYVDDGRGGIYRDRTDTDPGILSGQLDYSSGFAELFDYVVDGPASAFTLDSLITVRQPYSTASIFMRTVATPIKPASFVLTVTDVNGDEIVATAGSDGTITGPHLRGVMDFPTGLAELQFGDFVLDSSLTASEKTEWWYDPADVGTVSGQAGRIWRPWPVDPTTLRYNCVSYFHLPIDPEITGVDAVLLPQDGRVVVYRRGDLIVVGNTRRLEGVVVGNGDTVDLARERLSRVRVIGADGVTIHTGYDRDLDAGKVIFEDVTGYPMPLTIEHRVEETIRLRDVLLPGRLELMAPLSHDYSAGDTYVSSVLMLGDQQARVSAMWDQVAWTGVWSDSIIGNGANAEYNQAQFPVVVTNAGTITERWRIHMNAGGTTYNVIGEHVGQIVTGHPIAVDCSPMNHAAGQPYMTILAAGFGAGWDAGNNLRINTVGAQPSIWLVRSVQQGASGVTSDKFALAVRVDVDRP